MSDRPRILDELGRELVGAVRRHEQCDTRRCLPRAAVIALLALLGLAAAAVAATLIIGRGAPLSTARAVDVPLELRPVPGSARLNGLDVRDPDGGPAWDVRTSRGRTGAVCATVGQVLDGELGLLGLDRRFRALPAGAADTCSRAQPSGATLAGARGFEGGGRLAAVTAVSGVAAVGVRRVAVLVRGGTSVLRLGPQRAFLALLRGRPEELRPRLVLTEASGRRTTLHFADGGELVASDPSGGSPWVLRYGRGNGGRRCVEARREAGPDVVSSPSTAVPRRCAAPSRPFVAIRRFVPAVERVRAFGGRGPLMTIPARPWYLHPARTVVWGSTRRAGGEVLLTGAGAPRRLRVDARGDDAINASGLAGTRSGRGGFLAVLDGHVDPRRLRVTLDGRPLDPDATFDAGGRPIGREPVPAWRSVASARRASRSAAAHATPRAVVIARRAPDPVGGPAWALRIWTLAASAVAPGHNADRVLRCFAAGFERGRRLLEPLPGGDSAIVSTGGRDVVCAGEGVLAARVAAPDVRTYVDDVDAPDPRPLRVVVAGLLGDGVRSARLLGAGASRSLALGPHGSYLVVLGPRYAGAPISVRARLADGRSRVSGRATARMPPFEPNACVPTPGLSVRVADPDGRPSWTAGRGRAGAHNCRYLGRLVQGRLASVVDGSNRIFYEPSDVRISLTGRPRARSRPLVVEVTDPRGALSYDAALAARSPAQIARRTLPGRTVVSGTANDDVVSVTLRTPRDVRTLRPGPGGLFLAVYDGAFYGGRIYADAHLRDGRTITESIAIGQL